MLIGKVHPTTLEGVKSLATQIRKEQGIKHIDALDLAAKASGCTNFRHAQHTLPPQGGVLARHYVLLTIYWRDKTKQYQIGRETLKAELSRPILDICGKSALKKVRGFGDLRMVADDHFVCDTLAPTQTYARERLCTAERSLRFMEHTGLIPFREHRKANRNHLTKDRPPGNDHASYWVDPASGQFVLVDEPYRGVPREGERTAWATQTGRRIVKTIWPGMYNPHQCDLYIVADSGSSFNLDALVKKIDAMPAPLLETNWPGVSSPTWDTFVSPMAKTAQDVRRARCRGTIYSVSSATTVPYSYGLGSSTRRPAGKMGIKDHIEAGRIIKSVIQSDKKPWAVVKRMNSLRSTLEDWMSLEIGCGQLEGPEFFDAYYGGVEEDDAYLELAKSRIGIIEMLGILEQKLLTAYPDCAPRRKMFRHINMSVQMIDKMDPAND